MNLSLCQHPAIFIVIVLQQVTESDIFISPALFFMFVFAFGQYFDHLISHVSKYILVYYSIHGYNVGDILMGIMY